MAMARQMERRAMTVVLPYRVTCVYVPISRGKGRGRLGVGRVVCFDSCLLFVGRVVCLEG